MTRLPPAPPPAPDRPGTNLTETTVGELSQALKRTVESAFGYVRVRGEISQPKLHSSGHLYLRLKDETAVIEAVCWRSTVQRLTLRPADGLEVVCTGRLTTYPGRSTYQIIIESMALAGTGALLKLLEDRKRRLAAEGLFEAARKRPLPFLPTVIGVITSPTGAVIRDILHRLADRFPRHVLVWPVAVQGEQAAGQVAAAVEGFNRLKPGGPVPRPDLLIVARGGGSLEDLMPFNEEVVVRAVAASAIPVIAAVGHETDTTLIDLAADKRAPTPTAAAELAVPVRSDLFRQVLDCARRLSAGFDRGLGERRTRVDGLARGLGDPRALIETAVQRLDDRTERLRLAALAMVTRRRMVVGDWAGRLRHPRERLGQARERLASEGRALHAALRQRSRQQAERLDGLATRLERCVQHGQAERNARLDAAGKLLDSLSYRGVLRRGYAVVRDAERHALTSAAEAVAAAQAAGVVTIEFHDGECSAKLLPVQPDAHAGAGARSGE